MRMVLLFLLPFFHIVHLHVTFGNETGENSVSWDSFSRYRNWFHEHGSKENSFYGDSREESISENQQRLNEEHWQCFSQWITDLSSTPQTCSSFSNEYQLKLNIRNYHNGREYINNLFNLSDVDRTTYTIWESRVRLKLSNFWAQTRTGSDLVREYINLNGRPINTQSPTIAITDYFEDSESPSHGESAFHLIVGFFSSLPKRYKALVTKIQVPESLPEGYQSIEEFPDTELAQKIQESFPFSYINISLMPSLHYYCPSTESAITYCDGNTGRLSQILGKSQRKTVWGNSSGNSYPLTPFEHSDIFRPELRSVFFVGSMSPLGIISNFSQHSHIAAPSDYYVLSEANHNSPNRFSSLLQSIGPHGETIIRFGGTSGALPQVISSLAAFEIISHYHPTLDEAKKLLKMTGVLTIHTYEKFQIENEIQTNGTRSLNAYLLLKVAERLKEKCHTRHTRDTCFQEAIQNEDTYRFSMDHDVFTNIKRRVAEVFPQCIHHQWTEIEQPQNPPSNTCENKEDLLKTIRKQALLTYNPHLWSTLACIYESHDLKIDAYFYKLTSYLLDNEDQLKQSNNLQEIKNQVAREITERNFPPVMKVRSLLRLNLDKEIMAPLVLKIYNDPRTFENERKTISHDVEVQ